MTSIEMKDVVVHFRVSGGMVRAVDHISYTFEKGHITGLIGESGCGKSVMGAAILGLNPGYAQVSGSILYNGMDLLQLSQREMRALRGREIGLIPQNPADSLNPARRILGQITEAAALTGMPRAKQRETALELLHKFGFSESELGQVSKAYPFELSGGMQQRVAVAMGVASCPGWVLADEPSKGLDMALREQMYDTLRRIRDGHTDSMIIITHDLVLARTLCDTVAVMYSGQIVEQGQNVLENPKHPYTRGILQSLPENGFQPMKGIAPAPGDRFTGCKFAPRCPCAGLECTRAMPELYPAGTGKVRCFRYA